MTKKSRGGLFEMEFEYKGPSAWGNGAREWVVTLSRDGRKEQFPFNTGAAHREPDVDDVLYSLLSESMDYDTHRGWEEFALEFSYPPDDPSGRMEWEEEHMDIWRRMGKVHEALDRLLGDLDAGDVYDTHYQEY